MILYKCVMLKFYNGGNLVAKPCFAEADDGEFMIKERNKIRSRIKVFVQAPTVEKKKGEGITN